MTDNRALADYFTVSALNVLKMLLGEDPGVEYQTGDGVEVEDYDVAVSLEVTGAVKGHIVMLLSLATIELVADHLLHDLPEELRPSMKEHCVKEVVNMVTGEACTNMMNDDIEALPGVPIYYPRSTELKSVLEGTRVTRMTFTSTKGNIQFMVAVPGESQSSQPAPGAGGAKSVLLVDDSIFILKLLRMILEEGGYEVVGEAKDGDQAIHLFKTNRPALTVMDITMPNMNGIDAVKNIRNINKDARILVCSAVANSKLIRKALSEGVIEFLAKPFDRAQVLAAVERAIAAPPPKN